MAGGKFNNHSELLRSCCREVKAIEFEKKPDGDKSGSLITVVEWMVFTNTKTISYSHI